jgi:hypothetical protein
VVVCYSTWPTVGKYVYVANSDAGIQVVDVSNPTSPAVVRSIDMPGIARTVWIVGTRAYVASDGGVEVLDISTPALPKIVLSVGSSAMDVAVGEDHLCIVDGSRLQIFSVPCPDGVRMSLTP